MRKIKYNKFGVAENPIGLQVSMKYHGLVIMGDVTGFYRDEITGSDHLIVQHFNGDSWPIPPVANLVDVHDIEDHVTTRQDMINEAHYVR